MADLTRRLLLLARMDAGQLPASPEPVDLDLLAETAAESIAESASERGMTVLTDARSGALIRADQTMVIQAVLNLLENAVRYGREGGFIHLCVSVDGGEARLCVSDDGPGIPEKHLPHLFERFYQADAARHGQGAGLGLSLGERIMQLHGGRAEAASTPGKGSCFTLIFPAAGGET